MILPKLLMASAAMGTPVVMSTRTGHTDATIGSTDLLMESSRPFGSDETIHSAVMIGTGSGQSPTNSGSPFIREWENETTPVGAKNVTRRFFTPETSTFTINDSNDKILSMVPYAGSRLFNTPINNRVNSVAGTTFVNFTDEFIPAAENKLTLTKDGTPESMIHTGTALSPDGNHFYSLMRSQTIQPNTTNVNLVNADGSTYSMAWTNHTLWNYHNVRYGRISAIVKYDANTLKPVDHVWLHSGDASWESYAIPNAVTVNPDGTVSFLMEGHVMSGLASMSATGTNSCNFTTTTKKSITVNASLDAVESCISRGGNKVWYEYTTKKVDGPANRQVQIGVTAYNTVLQGNGTQNLYSHYDRIYDQGTPSSHLISIPFLSYINTTDQEPINNILWTYLHNNYATGNYGETASIITDIADTIFSPDNKWLYVLMSSGTVPTGDANAPAEMKVHQGGVDMYLLKYKVADLETGNPVEPQVINIGGTKDDYGRGIVFEEGTNDVLVYGDVMSKNGTFQNAFVNKDDSKFDTGIVRIKSNDTDFEIVQASSIQTVGESTFPSFVSTSKGTYFSLFTKDGALQDGIPNAGGDIVVGSLMSIIKVEGVAAAANQLFGYDIKDILPLWRKRPTSFANFSGYEDVDRDGVLDTYLDYIKWKAEKIHTSRIAVTASAFGVSATEVLRTVTTKQELEQYILEKNAETGKEFQLPSITEEEHEAIEAGFDIHRTNMLVEFMQNNALLLIGAGAFVALYIALIILNKKQKEISEIESN